MKKSLLYTALLVISAGSAFAAADDAQKASYMRQKVQYEFNQMDANGDGFITKDEMVAYVSKKFDDADKNHDGKLTVDEIMDQKMKDNDAFKASLGKNTSDTSSATKMSK